MYRMTGHIVLGHKEPKFLVSAFCKVHFMKSEFLVPLDHSALRAN